MPNALLINRLHRWTSRTALDRRPDPGMPALAATHIVEINRPATAGVGRVGTCGSARRGLPGILKVNQRAHFADRLVESPLRRSWLDSPTTAGTY